MHKLLPYLLLVQWILIPSGSAAQKAIGEWKTHLTYYEARQVAVAGQKVYCGTRSGLFYFNREDNSVNVITKVDGLSDLEISAMGYAGLLDLVFVGYRNTNIDMISGNEIFNLPDIKRKQILGNKVIHNVLIVDKLAYLSCGFGIVVVNLEKKEIKDTYYIGENGALINVYDMAFDGTNLYAATETGLYTAPVENTNLVDFNNWNRVETLPFPNGSYHGVAWYDSRLYAAYRPPTGSIDSLFHEAGGVWEGLGLPSRGQITDLKQSGNKLLVASGERVAVFSGSNTLERTLFSLDPLHAELDEQDHLWVADRFEGMYWSPSEFERVQLLPEGPISTDVAANVVTGDRVYSVAGNVTVGWNNTFNHAELNIYHEGEWSGSVTADYRDLVHLAVDPADPAHVFAASWGYGLVEYRNAEIVEVYDETNSSLQALIEDFESVRIGGVCYDPAGNLWMTNAGVPEPITVRKPDGSFKSFKLDGQLRVTQLGRIMNTSADHNWVLCPLGGGLFAFDVAGTVDDVSDDRYKKFNILDVNGKIISNNVFSMVEDLEGNIWVGTDKGVVVYYSPSRVFDDEPFYAQQIIVPRNDGTGLADILLATETVTALAVDGANRKWIGTAKSGVYLLSPDGLEEIHHFTEENSPLLSNYITDIAIDQNKGLVYLGTDRGNISYKSTAIGGKENFADVYVYPNPVRQDHEGEIVITGLVGNVNVKITDIGGNIVYETTALGGQAIWDGRTFSGERVSTGIYLVFISSEDGSQTHITKLMVVN